MNNNDKIIGQAVVDGLRCNPRDMPITTIMARDNHVASRESINTAQALFALLRNIIVISIIHNAKTKMLRGKLNIPTGKLPKTISAIKDKESITPTMQTALR